MMARTQEEGGILEEVKAAYIPRGIASLTFHLSERLRDESFHEVRTLTL